MNVTTRFMILITIVPTLPSTHWRLGYCKRMVYVIRESVPILTLVQTGWILVLSVSGSVDVPVRFRIAVERVVYHLIAPPFDILCVGAVVVVIGWTIIILVIVFFVICHSFAFYG